MALELARDAPSGAAYRQRLSREPSALVRDASSPWPLTASGGDGARAKVLAERARADDTAAGKIAADAPEGPP